MEGVNREIARKVIGRDTREIKGMAEDNWKPYKTEGGDDTDREIAETAHATNKGERHTSCSWKWDDGF